MPTLQAACFTFLRHQIHKRDGNVRFWRDSPALFLPARNQPASAGRLSPCSVSAIWTRVSRLADVEKFPHAARHAMGLYLIEATGNPAAVQAQLNHANVSCALAYCRPNPHAVRRLIDDRSDRTRSIP